MSYVAGMNATRCLIPYIQQSFQVDTAYMENFLRGYKDALAMGINPKTVAYSAGMEVAKLVEKRVYPGTKEELKSTGDSISHAMFQNGFIAALANDTTFFTSKTAADFQKEALAGAGEKFLAANAKKPGYLLAMFVNSILGFFYKNLFYFLRIPCSQSNKNYYCRIAYH